MKKCVLAVFLSLFIITTGNPADVKADPAAEPAAGAGNPGRSVHPPYWKKQLNSAFFIMRQTATGMSYYDYGLENRLKPVGFADTQDVYEAKDDMLRMNWQVVYYPAWPEYIAWVTVQGFVRFQHNVILKEYGSPLIGNLEELDQWAILMAMRHWCERDAKLEYDLDTDFTRKHEARVSLFYDTWSKDLDGFLKLTAARHKRLYADSTTMEEFLKNPELPQATREAVLDLAGQWQAVLAEEISRRPGEADRFVGIKPVIPGSPAMESPVLNQLRSLNDDPLP